MVSSDYLCKCGCGGKHSLEGLYQVILWSLRFGALGKSPSRRHDLSPFGPEDEDRSHLVGQQLSRKLLLLWLKGDWDALANYFGLPHWGAKRCCWLCSATKAGFRSMELGALEEAALSSREFFAWAKETGKLPVSLFSSPGVGTWSVPIDWMHTVDLGVAQDVIGGLMYCLLEVLPGSVLSRGGALVKHMSVWGCLMRSRFIMREGPFAL